jgi:predicted RNase H-like HicB family nuclease
MNKSKITYWQDGEYYLGYMNDYPEYITQGFSLEELIDNIKDIKHDIENELIPGKRYTIELDLT